MRRSQNHLFEAPVDTSAAGTWVADRRVADMPAVEVDWRVGADFADHQVQHHN